MASVRLSLRVVFAAVLALLLLVAAGVWTVRSIQEAQPIRIGVLHSLTGVMAQSEAPLADAVRLAVEEINGSGGLLGRQVEIVQADGASDNALFVREAERLIKEEKVSALFACWTSSCRKAVKPVVERYDHLMFYSVQYEGLEQSPNIIYLGATPNQQIIPGVYWALKSFGGRVFIVGSDYIYPRVAGRIINDMVTLNRGEVVGERYLSLLATDFSGVAAEIAALKPDVVFNNINGGSNVEFFKALHQVGVKDIPVMSFSLDEVLAKEIGSGENYYANHYAVWSYFQSLPGEANKKFVEAYQARFGADRVVTASMVNAYTAAKLWANAVQEVGVTNAEEVAGALSHQSVAGPTGPLPMDRTTQHLWQQPYFGKARADGQFEIVGGIDALTRPDPFPVYRTVRDWQKTLKEIEERGS